MAITNPSASDFKNNQTRALDYQQYRTSADVLRAVAEFYKATAFKSISDGTLNFVTNGFDTTAWTTDSNLNIEITKGICLLDNQTVQMKEDFIFQYDKPDSDKNYYVYLYYKYVAEYPANYAQIQVYTSEVNTYGHNLIAKVKYTSSSDNTEVDTTPKDALKSKYVQPAEPTSGKLMPAAAADGDTITSGKLYFIDTSNGAVSVTLDKDAPKYSNLAVFDKSGSFDKNNLTIKAPDGYTVNGADSFVVDKKSAYVQLQLTNTDSDKNWYVVGYEETDGDTEGGKLLPITVDSDGSVIENFLYMVDTSNGAVTLTMPDSPKKNSLIVFYDKKSTFKDNNLTVKAPDGYKVHGEDSLTFDQNRSFVEFQLLDPDNDKNWYLLDFDSETIDGGTF